VGARFSVPIQTDAKARQVSSTMVVGPFPGVKRPRREAGHTHTPLLALRLRVGRSYTSAYPVCLRKHVIRRPLPLPQITFSKISANRKAFQCLLLKTIMISFTIMRLRKENVEKEGKTSLRVSSRSACRFFFN